MVPWTTAALALGGIVALSAVLPGIGTRGPRGDAAGLSEGRAGRLGASANTLAATSR